MIWLKDVWNKNNIHYGNESISDSDDSSFGSDEANYNAVIEDDDDVDEETWRKEKKNW